MLWYKAWLETRWRMLLPLGMVVWALFQADWHGDLRFGKGSLLAVLPAFWMIVPLTLAGSGIRTEAPFRPMKGIQGSVYFTLSLPVSRLRVFLSRVAFGISATAAFIAVVCCTVAIVFPKVGAHFTLVDGLMYILTALLCNATVFGLSTLFSTFLDQQWQVVGTMGVVFLLRYLSVARNVFRAMGDASPLVTHALPWTEIGISVGLGAVFLLAAAKVVQMREY